MTERLSERVQALFDQAVELSPEQRAAFLDAACSQDPTLRAAVEGLLAYDAGPSLDSAADGRLRSPLVRTPPAFAAADTPLADSKGATLCRVAAGEELAGQLPPRYQVGEEVGHGGMGLVLRGRDTEMDREVAVKVLLASHQDRPDLRQRFVEEARISGRLQHPGVVPVYDLGRFADQRPYFTMKLVRGRTLAQLLAGRRQPGEEQARFVGVFLQVCQAVAYAHARRVIHRDLKPANVMVGDFGEVQVMDWGLAKVLGEQSGEGEPPGEGVQQGAPDPTSPGATRPGQVMGTLAYMSPEQASGAVGRLDERSDVFGLGAILCEVLTGKPPYVGPDQGQLFRKAATADLADARARLHGCGADVELVGLALACLAPSPADRPKDAQAVADALTAHLEGVQIRLRQAELAEAEARARATAEAARRRMTLALAGTVLLAVTLGGGGALWLQADRQARQTRIAREANDALQEVTRLREKARAGLGDSAALLAQAREQAQRALTLVQTGPPDEGLQREVRRVRGELDEEDRDRQFIAALDDARLAGADTLPGRSRFALESIVPQFRDAFRAYGLPPGEGEPAEAAARLWQRPRPVREAAAAALEEWFDLVAAPELQIDEPHLDWLQTLAAAGPDEGGMREIRAACREKDPGLRRAALEKLAAAADERHLPPGTLTRLANRLWNVQSTDSAVALLRRARRQYPADFWVNHDLGFMLSDTPRWAEAARYLTAAVALRPNSPGVHVNLGRALGYGGQFDEAIACFQQALTLAPKYANAHHNLGRALAEKGQVDEAIASHRKAIEIDPNNVEAHNNLAIVLAEKGEVDEAIACFRKSVAISPKRAHAHYNLGRMLATKGEVDEAIACYRKAIAINPKYADAHNNLGNVLAARGKIDEAIASYGKAIESNPKHNRAHHNLGVTLATRGEVNEAIACYRKAIEIDPKFADAHSNLGAALAAKGEIDEAISCYRKAIAFDPKHSVAHNNLGFALEGKGKADEAIACYRKAIALDPKFADAYLKLGVALTGKGEVDEAIACYRKAIAIAPHFAQAHNNLGLALEGKGEADEAIACYRKAIAIDPKLPQPHANLGLALRARGQLNEAREAFVRALERYPTNHPFRATAAQQVQACERLVKLEERLPRILRGEDKTGSAGEGLELAHLCQLKRRYAAAARFYASAFAAAPGLAEDLNAGNRYDASRCAALAAAAKGADDARPDDKERARLRQQALDWLRADLTLRRRALQQGNPEQASAARAALVHWQKDADLAGVRAAEELKNLPVAEQQSWRGFWADVQDLLAGRKDASPRP
jgi:serine/threonine-protein kinase